MSKRFQKWVEVWIEENVHPHVNADIESNDARTARLTAQMFAEATAAGFSKFEMDEEKERASGQVKATVANATDFDIDHYKLKSALAMENEDGD